VSLRVRILLAVVLVAVVSLGIAGFFATRVALQRLPDALRTPGVIEQTAPRRLQPPGDISGEGPRMRAAADERPRTGRADDDDDEYDDEEYDDEEYDDEEYDDDFDADDLFNDDGPLRLGARFNPVLASEIREVQAWAGGFALLIALAVGTVLAVGIARPIDRLADVTRRFGQGERDLRAEPSGPKELAQLARTFNETADALQEERLRRDRLTSDVAHELRTPLSVLKAELEAVQDGVYRLDDDRLTGLVRRVDMLSQLVDDLRSLSQADEGALRLQPVVLDALKHAQGVTQAFEGRAPGVTLETRGEPTTVFVDPLRFTQMLENLLSNALRHAQAQVRVTVTTHRGAPTVWVDDDGQGIPESERDRVFERLYRLDAARQSDSGGSGLGLALTRALARAQGGNVQAFASPLGGARFEVRLAADASDVRTGEDAAPL
jgi:two-component system sensor histidine kinase BaeS